MHRPLIRASLPRQDGQQPPPRPIPEFTIRQPGGRPNRFRPRHQGGGGPARWRSAVSRKPIERQSAGWPAAGHAAERRTASPWSARTHEPSPTAAETVPAASAPSKASRAADPESRTLTSNSDMPDLAGKHGLIVGVANKRSISWAIAQAAAAAGARLALTYPSERLEENVRELAAKLDNPVVAAVRRRQRSADYRSRRDARP